METKTSRKWDEVRLAYDGAKDEKQLAEAKALQKNVQDSMKESELEEFNEALLEDTYAILAAGERMVEEHENEKMRSRLGELPEAISLSYIAKKYFGKSRSWMIQRINGNIVNGKEARFNREEILRLQEALHDLGDKLSSVALV